MRLHSPLAVAAQAACAALEETGAAYEIVTTDGLDQEGPPEFAAAAGGRREPVLEDGEARIPGTAAIILWLGDRFPDSPLLAPVGTARRAEADRWLTYLSNTLLTTYQRWWAPQAAHIDPDVARVMHTGAAVDLNAVFDFVERELTGREHLVESGFTGADLLLHMLASPAWTAGLAPPVLTRPNLAAHHARIAARPAVTRMRERLEVDRSAHQAD